jgi:hypothetical protein
MPEVADDGRFGTHEEFEKRRVDRRRKVVQDKHV